MKRSGAAQRAGSIVLLLISAGSAPFAVAQHDGIPDTIVAERVEVETPPELQLEGIELEPLSDYLWVSAEAVDRLGLGVLFRPTAMSVERRLQSSSVDAACPVDEPFMCVLLSSDVALRDFHHMVDSSRSIVEGTVIGHRGGFFRQDMGFLVALEIDNVLAHDDATPTPAGRILVFYPGPGSFTVLGKELCLPNRGRDSLPAVPTAEDRVILFSGYQVIDAGSEPISVFDGNVVVGRADGSIAMPAKLRDDPALKGTTTFDDVRREIARRRAS